MWEMLILLGFVVTLIMYLMCVHAAEGYQDEKGFHYGKEPIDDPLNKSK